MMAFSMKSTLSIRIGTHDVTAELSPWNGPARKHAVPVSVSAPGPEGDWSGAVTAALNEALTRIVSGRQLVSPHVHVAISSPYIRTGVLRFATLPRPAADRALVVAQRFCRDHKLDARATAVAFSTHAGQDGQHVVLADATQRTFIDGLLAAAASHGLHCDVISSDVSLALAAHKPNSAAASVLCVCAGDNWSLLFLDDAGAPAGVTTLVRDGATLGTRMAARITRYAAQSGKSGNPTDVPVSFSDPTGTAHDDILAIQRQLEHARAA